MTSTSRARWSVAAVVFALWFALPSIGAGQAPVRKSVLVLHTYPLASVFRSRFDAALQETLQKDGLEDVDIYEETVESNRSAGDKHSALFRRYLADKYSSRELDVVVTVWDRALNYALENRASLFPDAPIVALVQRSRSLPADVPVTQITTGAQFTDTVRLALTLHPNTRRIAVVDGMLESNDDVQTEVLEQLKAFLPRVTLQYLRDLPLADLLHEVKGLPGDSLILYARQMMKTPMTGMAQTEALKSIAHASHVPIYVVTDQLIGLGAVGGFVMEAESFAQLAADTALRVATGAHVRDIPTRAGPIRPMFDWRQLARFGVTLDKLPAGSDVRFREYTFWEQNQRYVIAALVVFLVQTCLIIGLLIQHARRRRAEQALRTNEQALRASHDDTRKLAGRIIAAQEVERARIARELHDDISQKVALLAMDIHQVSKGAALTIAGRVNVMADRASEIATDLHNLSHELHPSKLQILGLVPATQYFCRDFAARHKLTVDFTHDRMPQIVPGDPALCLFRIAQEALQNVAKHSGATNAAVKLTGEDGFLHLEVIDSGAGFDAQKLSTGMGLLSMRERVYFLGGDMDIWSMPGAGTQISVRVPVPPSAVAANETVTRIA